jgi:ribosomal protein S18 acetylase RimI-like enzyme
MSHEIREMTSDDYDQAYRLWSEYKGLCLGDDDARDRIELYLRRNPGLCFVALSEGNLVGTILCGHDGRRGILRHLAVKQEHRRKGIASALINVGLAALARSGIRKCNLFVEDYNPDGLRF